VQAAMQEADAIDLYDAEVQAAEEFNNRQRETLQLVKAQLRWCTAALSAVKHGIYAPPPPRVPPGHRIPGQRHVQQGSDDIHGPWKKSNWKQSKQWGRKRSGW